MRCPLKVSADSRNNAVVLGYRYDGVSSVPRQGGLAAHTVFVGKSPLGPARRSCVGDILTIRQRSGSPIRASRLQSLISLSAAAPAISGMTSTAPRPSIAARPHIGPIRQVLDAVTPGASAGCGSNQM
jgi:hypothetical protein